MTEPQPERAAVIDLGSNTARVVVIEAVRGHTYRLVDEIREVVRLREGLDASGLSSKAMQRALSTLSLFKQFCSGTQVTVVLAVATSAVREASNGPQFVRQVRREIGLDLRVLTGEEEAYYGTLGALNEVLLADGYVVDIGGGSAQISEVRRREFRRGEALTLGALALSERFVHSDPPRPGELAALQQEIGRQLDSLSWLKPRRGFTLVGLGGTIRNLARIEATRVRYPLETLHGFTLSAESVAESIDLLRRLPLASRRQIAGLNEDRADIILAGALVIEAIMRRLECSALTVSVNGLREGLFFEWFWQHLATPVISDVRRFSVLNTARTYHYQREHANHVRFLAGRLFVQMALLHGYSSGERELLEAAALLHDLGTIISYRGHHRHSQTLITNAGLPGFSPRETALIALLARYHRAGRPDPGEMAPLLRDDDEVLLKRLTALLRLAEYLERGRTGTVEDITAEWDDRTLRLTLIADTYPAVELWEAERNAVPLLQEAFQCRVQLDTIAPPPA